MKTWPVRVTPIAGEALSSWLARNAAIYNFELGDFITWIFPGSKKVYCIDFDADRSAIQTLSRLSRISPYTLKHMTIEGMAPYTFGAEAGSFDDYVFKDTVLLDEWRGWKGCTPIPQDWSPWICKTMTVACPECTNEDEVPIVRPEWLIPITLSCWKHRRWLVSCYIRPGASVSWHRTPSELENPSDDVLAMDRISVEILKEGRLDIGKLITAREWFRVLRTIIEEIIQSKNSRSHAENDLIRALWSTAGETKPRHTGKPYEHIKWEDQRKYLKVAAVAIAYLKNQRNFGHKLYGLSVWKEQCHNPSDWDTVRQYLHHSRKLRVWKQLIKEGGYKRAQSDPVYATMLRDCLMAQEEVSKKRAWMVKEFLRLSGIVSYS